MRASAAESRARLLVIMTNKTLNVAEAKQRFSEIVGRVAYAGEEFIIARRGRPMARLVPAGAKDVPHLARVKGWLDADDPMFAAIDEIVASRPRHVPRVARGRRRS
jgi:prevent-host-death family protein